MAKNPPKKTGSAKKASSGKTAKKTEGKGAPAPSSPPRPARQSSGPLFKIQAPGQRNTTPSGLIIFVDLRNMSASAKSALDNFLNSAPVNICAATEPEQGGGFPPDE